MTDPITDMLNRIRNALMAGKTEVSLPYSELKFNIARIMEEAKLIEKIEKKGRKNKKFLDIVLKYEEKRPLISGLKRVSRPGQRIYFSYRQIRPVKGGYGISIFSTPKGLMSGKEARRQKVGGEFICEIW